MDLDLLIQGLDLESSLNLDRSQNVSLYSADLPSITFT